MDEISMQEPLSRRSFLTRATVVGGATLLGATPETAANASAPAPSVPTKRGKRMPAPYRPSRADMEKAYQRQQDYDALIRQPIYKAQIDPHWFGDNTRFWYRNLGPKGTKEFLLVDAAHGMRKPAFDHAKLAAGLSHIAGRTYQGERLPFDSIVMADDLKSVHFSIGDAVYACDLASYVCTKRLAESAEENRTEDDAAESAASAEQAEGEWPSPDGRWTAYLKDNNVWARARADGKEIPLSREGTEARPFGELQWSPDSKTLVGYAIDPVQDKDVYMIESTPKAGGFRGVLHHHSYPQPGDRFNNYEMWLFQPETQAATRAQTDAIDYGDGPPDLHWHEDGSRFLFERTNRGHQRFRLIEVEALTGKTRHIIDEQTETFLNTSNSYLRLLRGSNEAIYVSERDGWRHLYLYDTARGALKNRITQGEWVVRSVERLDNKERLIWFTASGRNPGEDPYHIHHYRVSFDGTGLVALTDGDGSHSVQYSPDRRYLIDTYSRADMPPVHTLRRVSDGGKVCDLERSDISALQESGWRMPEVFRAKGRDGQTDIWGVVFRPTNFDPNRRYPVIENIYAGPQDSFVRKTFAVRDGMQSLAELGFIVVQCDGMGTRNRSKAFHDVCWRNIKDAGFPDRIAWIKALAAKYPYCDTDRVGIYGTSAGGQNSTGALLFHPEFYKVAVSSCGCHDNRIDKRWWNEQWMGYPVGPWYGDNSNITHADKLRGKLLLMVGELDTNVPPESTIRLADALIKAGKDFDLLVLPGLDHTSGGTYGERRRRDYFVRHLLGIEPPDRNAPQPPPPPPGPLVAHSPADEYLARPDGGEETTVIFRNHSGQRVNLFWLPGDGSRKAYGSLAPGETRDMHTYAGHVWLVTGESGHGIALFVSEAHPGIAEIKSPVP